jgi:hypothetical protein
MIKLEQKPFNEEQYQRCLKAARKMSYAILDIKNSPINPELLNVLFNAGSEFEKVIIEVVNESCE